MDLMFAVVREQKMLQNGGNNLTIIHLENPTLQGEVPLRGIHKPKSDFFSGKLGTYEPGEEHSSVQTSLTQEKLIGSGLVLFYK